MKIAVFASSHGEKALNLHDFFKEGDRIAIDLLVTDNPNAPVIQKLQNEGIEALVITPAHTGEFLADTLRKRNVELLVIDEYESPIPEEVRTAYGEAVVSPDTPQSAPLDLIKTIDRINAASRNLQAGGHSSEQSESKESQDEPTDDIDKEWADALKVDMNPEPEQIVIEEAPKYTPEQPQTPPQYGQPSPQNPAPPGYGNFSPGSSNIPTEPMPDTYLVWSVVIALLCCLIPGVIAIIYSASVSSKYYRGDLEGSRRASRNAQIWCIVSIVAGIVWATLYIPLSLLLP